MQPEVAPPAAPAPERTLHAGRRSRRNARPVGATRGRRGSRPGRFEELDGLGVLHAQLAGELPAPPIHHLMGVTLTAVKPGEAEFQLPASEWLCAPPRGRVQGGAVALLAESALSAAIQTTVPAESGSGPDRPEDQLPAPARRGWPAGHRDRDGRPRGTPDRGRELDGHRRRCQDDRGRDRVGDDPPRPAGVAGGGGGVIRRVRALLVGAISRHLGARRHAAPRRASCRPRRPPRRGAALADPPSHVAVILMENEEFGDIIGSSSTPYINELAKRYALATLGVRDPPSVASQLPRPDGWLDLRDHERLQRLQRPGIGPRRAAARAATELEGLHGGPPPPLLRGRGQRQLRQEARPVHVLPRDRPRSVAVLATSCPCQRSRPTSAPTGSRASSGSRRTCATTCTTAAPPSATGSCTVSSRGCWRARAATGC